MSLFVIETFYGAQKNKRPLNSVGMYVALCALCSFLSLFAVEIEAFNN